VNLQQQQQQQHASRYLSCRLPPWQTASGSAAASNFRLLSRQHASRHVHYAAMSGSSPVVPLTAAFAER
jgi:hypothetical protein